MLGVAALATSAMDLLQSLTAKKTSTSSSSSQATTGLSQGSSFQISSPAEIRSLTGTTTPPANISASTMSALLDAQSQSNVSSTSKTRSDALKSLFNQLDGDGDGSISKSEFEDKLGAGGTNTANADKVFAKLDTDGDGSVSIDELGKALKGGGGAQQASGVGGGGGGGDDTSGATTTTMVNADGSTTTSITYADGSTVTSTSAVPASSATAAASSSYNAIEKMIANQAKQIASASSSVAISA